MVPSDESFSPREQTIEEVKQRIVDARTSAPEGVLAFDCDGTLWSGDIGEDSFLARVETMLADSGPLSDESTQHLREIASPLGIDAHDGAETAKLLFAAYTQGKVDEELMCEVMAWLYAGWEHQELHRFVKRVVAERGLKARLHHEACAVGSWAKTEGIPVYFVSASPLGVLQAAIEVLDWTPTEIVAATQQAIDGVLQARVHRPIPYGPGKVKRLAERTQGATVLAAFGDNVFDLALLSSANVPVAIRPKPKLRARLSEHPGVVVLKS
ncbi:MAG: haloacid dehalogenase-like hydrolase [Polyangiaceae bacterium]